MRAQAVNILEYIDDVQARGTFQKLGLTGVSLLVGQIVTLKYLDLITSQEFKEYTVILSEAKRLLINNITSFVGATK